jgi:hypothetical protein
VGGLVEGRPLGAQAAAIGRVIRITTQSGNRTVIGFDQYTATNAAVATGRFDFSFHVFPSGRRSATPMPSRKIMDLHEKRGSPSLDFPLFGASTVAFVPI